MRSREAGRPYASFDGGPLAFCDEATGVRYDFNFGARVLVPGGNYRVRFCDRDACMTLYDMPADGVLVVSVKKYFIRFRIEVELDGKPLFSHDYDARGRKVLLRFLLGALGDVIAWFPYARVFARKHGCAVFCAMDEELAALFAPAYPELRFVGPDESPAGTYASYHLGAFRPYEDRSVQPVDWRVIGLQQIAPLLLGLEPVEARPVVLPKDRRRKIAEPYVCIAAQATGQSKYWNNPTGWSETIAYLKQRGYRVLCIDRERCYGAGARWNLIPPGAEDFTGALPLQDRVDLLYHADFFIGLSSGLSWLAWAAGKEVVLISGFSLPLTEFYTPYRVINYHVCNGCWTDSSVSYDQGDFEWCPRHKNTDRQFECTRLISAGQVRQAIDRLLGCMRGTGGAPAR